MTFVPPQFVVTKSLKLIVAVPQPSSAPATPVMFVVVTAGHSSVMSVGTIKLGGVVSLIVIVWMRLVVLPHSSVAVHVRKMTFVPAQLLLTESLKLTLGVPQESCALATPVELVPVSAGHSKMRFVGMARLGRVVSRTVIL